ncbi:MAG: MFS transporter [Geodermatophilaceae bacterium]|nr:MFS transporter [Geodermatophilaceae bacterium]MDQ3463995.1 MFS transporter [Actinomycetota bacterium]
MFGPYSALFRVDGSWQFSSAGFVARLPISMMGIGTVLLISQTTGRYALAGAVAGVIALSSGVFGPVSGRLMDRFGQARILRPFLLAYVVGVAGLIVAVRTEAPVWTWFLAAVVSGAVPQFGSLVRARWAAVLPAGAARQTAFAFESVVDEVVFVTGPPLVTFLAIGVSPAAGLMAAVVFALTGGLALAALRRTEPAPAPKDSVHPGFRAVMRPGLLVVSLTMLGAGAVFGSVEVTVIAYADELGAPAWAGAILAVYAGGSLLAGLAYGARQWRRELGRRFLLAAVIFGAAATMLLAVNSLPLLAVVMFVSGMSISPVLIGGTSLIDSLMPPGTLTEGLAWVSTGLILGVTVGAALSGPIIDAFGAQRAFVLPAMAGVSTGVIALAGSRWLVGRGSVMLAR